MSVKTFIEHATKLMHEVIEVDVNYKPSHVYVRCRKPMPRQRDPASIRTGVVTCIACLGWVDPEHDTYCVTNCPDPGDCDQIHSCWCGAERKTP